MKDYKEKYEQLAKFIKDLYPFMSDYCKEKTEGMIPELKESEDERIRKGLIQHLEILRGWTPGDPSPIKVKEHYDAWIDWLEKQELNRLEKEIELAYKTADEVQYRNGFKAGQNEVLENPQKYGLEKQYENMFSSSNTEKQSGQKDKNNRKSLNFNEIAVGDIITYFKDGKKGIMLVSSFDSGIYPRCKWGISDITGTAYGDWSPGVETYYTATEEEKQKLLNSMPKYIKVWFEKQREQ